MPLISSRYAPPAALLNAHLHTIFPVAFRPTPKVSYLRERLETPDSDFLDLDWSRKGSDRLVIVSHGLEGHSGRKYVKAVIRHFNAKGWDGLGWNFRGCGGEPNRLPRSYHSGCSEDLDCVVRHAIASRKYRRLSLVGFSVGGNVTLKYLGEQGSDVPSELCAAAVFSVPCDLESTAYRLAESGNRFYLKRFLIGLTERVEAKARLLPGHIDLGPLRKVRDFHDFDTHYTAPLCGFRSAQHYWRVCSSLNYLEGIRIPVLLASALDDPFLTPECFPVTHALRNPMLHLESPRWGGHCAFVEWNGNNEYWAEKRAYEFVANV